MAKRSAGGLPTRDLIKQVLGGLADLPVTVGARRLEGGVDLGSVERRERDDGAAADRGAIGRAPPGWRAVRPGRRWRRARRRPPRGTSASVDVRWRWRSARRPSPVRAGLVRRLPTRRPRPRSDRRRPTARAGPGRRRRASRRPPPPPGTAPSARGRAGPRPARRRPASRGAASAPRAVARTTGSGSASSERADAGVAQVAGQRRRPAPPGAGGGG